MDNQDLIPLVEKVAELRNSCRIMSAKELELIDEVRALPKSVALEALQNGIARVSHDLGLAQEELKSAALAVYEETGEKKPADKVEIKIFKSLEYDALEALDWCRRNSPALLMVNKKPFEKAAVEIGAPVRVTEKAKCTIGTDLSSYLNTKKEVKENAGR